MSGTVPRLPPSQLKNYGLPIPKVLKPVPRGQATWNAGSDLYNACDWNILRLEHMQSLSNWSKLSLAKLIDFNDFCRYNTKESFEIISVRLQLHYIMDYSKPFLGSFCKSLLAGDLFAISVSNENELSEILTKTPMHDTKVPERAIINKKILQWATYKCHVSIRLWIIWTADLYQMVCWANVIYAIAKQELNSATCTPRWISCMENNRNLQMVD